MKIVHIEDFFHPDAGYQINILTKYQARKGYEVIIITSQIDKIPYRLKGFFGSENINERDAAFSKLAGVKIIRVPIFKYYSGRAIYTSKLFKVVDELKPDILYVHGNDSFAGIIFTLFYRRLKHAMIMDNHMLEMATSNRFHKLFRWWYKTFIKRRIVKNQIHVIRVVNSDYVIQQLGIPGNLSPVILLGTDTLQFHPDSLKRKAFRDANDLKDSDFVVLYMGKITEDKGVMFLAEAFRKKFDLARDVILLIVGTASSEYGNRVLKLLDESENRILRFPTQKYSDLANFYLMSDLVVFPKHCSLSFFDAQASGIPVLVEDNEINQSRIMMNNGIIFDHDSIVSLREKLEYVISLPEEEKLRMNRASYDYIKQNDLDYSFIADQYDNVIMESIKKFKSKTGAEV